VKRSLTRCLACLAFLGLASCTTMAPMTGIVLFAQSLPVTDHVVWTPNVASDNVTNYVVTVDTVPQNFAPASCTVAQCSCPITIATFGSHTVTVAAQNQPISTDPTSTQTSAPASVTFTQNTTPAVTTGATVTK